MMSGTYCMILVDSGTILHAISQQQNEM